MDATMMMGRNRQAVPEMEPGDENLFVQIYMGSQPNAEKTREAGHPVFDDVPMIKIMVPGDKNSIIDTRVDDRYRRRFALRWQQFEAQQDQAVQGMPIREWPAITRGQSDELYFLNILTVEMLANCADVYGAKIMGFNELRRKAQVYLEQAKDSAAALALADQNKALTDRVEAQDAEIARLSAAFEAMQKKAARREQRNVDNSP